MSPASFKEEHNTLRILMSSGGIVSHTSKFRVKGQYLLLSGFCTGYSHFDFVIEPTCSTQRRIQAVWSIRRGQNYHRFGMIRKI